MMKSCIGDIVMNFEPCQRQVGPFKKGDIIEIEWPDGDVSEVGILDVQYLPNGAIKLEVEPLINNQKSE